MGEVVRVQGDARAAVTACSPLSSDLSPSAVELAGCGNSPRPLASLTGSAVVVSSYPWCFRWSLLLR